VKNIIVMTLCLLMHAVSLHGSQVQVRHNPTKYQERMQKARKRVSQIQVFSDAQIAEMHEARQEQWAKDNAFVQAMFKQDVSGVYQALSCGANPHAREQNWDLPLWVFLFGALPDKTCLEILPYIDVTIDSSVFNAQGMTILMYAAQNNNDGLARFILQQKIDINQIDQDGHTALWYAVHNRSYGVLLTLLAHKNINREVIDATGLTPLGWAARYVKIDSILTLLLADGASQEDKDQALVVARECKNMQAVMALLSFQAQDQAKTESTQAQTVLNDLRATPESIGSTSSERSDSLQVEEWNGSVSSNESSVGEVRSAVDRDFIAIKSEEVSPVS